MTVVTDPAVVAARAADSKKAEEILVLDVGEVLGIVGTFVIAGASNARLVRAIVEEIEDRLREDLGRKPRSVEGLSDASWVLLDYGDLVVHVFLAETREFYGLERLWSDVPRLEWEGVTASGRES
ncbi:MAG: ribosome silencing factor [Actinomycetota bacterium]